MKRTDQKFRRPFSNDQSLIEIAGASLIQTEKALLFDDGTQEIWLPLSQLEDWPELGQNGVVVLPEWLAKSKEMI